MTTTPRSWLSLHIYYATGQDQLLLQCVRPLLGSLYADGRLARHFYIRYGENGPHLRLRLLPAATTNRADLHDVATARIAHFIATEPAPDTHLRSAVPNRRVLNNVVQEEPYVPELQRYGGSPGVEVAEDHFCESSEIALDVVASTETQLAARNAIAIRLLLLAATTFHSDVEAVRAFVAPYSSQMLSANGFSEEQQQHLRSRYEALFAPQKAAVQKLVAAHLDGTASAASAPYDKWVRSLQSAWRRLDSLRLLDRTDQAFRILSSYVHLMLNRLGLGIAEEGYLLHMLERTLQTQRN
jgi:thiopeptide-type bacteriocin biosynthesis protein